MLAVLMVLAIIGFIFCNYMRDKARDNYETWEWISPGFFIIGVIAFGCIVWMIDALVNGRDIKSRIAMYEERNAIIEQQVELTVKTFTDHETEVFNDANPESFITLVSLYPELKSDELMSKQIDVYLDNNQRICDLKEEELKLQRARFWLYFGK